jgi:hypothetical protein
VVLHRQELCQELNLVHQPRDSPEHNRLRLHHNRRQLRSKQWLRVVMQCTRSLCSNAPKGAKRADANARVIPVAVVADAGK